MGWLLRHNWLWSLIAFLLGAVITWLLLARRDQPATPVPSHDAEEPLLVGASVGAASAGAASAGDGTAHSSATAAPAGTSAAERPPVANDAGAEHPADEPPAVAAEVPPTNRAEPAKSEAAIPEEAVAAAEPRAGERATEGAVPEEPVAAAQPVAGERATEGAVPGEAAPVFSRRMEAERSEAPTLFDDADDTAAPGPEQPDVVPPGRYGEGSADAVPHQGPPDGFTIKGNAQSMLFHTPDSPYYGRTKPQVWFRTEADAERAGFTKYVRRPRKSPDPRD